MTATGLYRRVLNTIYDVPAGVTIIKGRWKTGKTDFALKLYEELKELDLISEAAGNVQLFEDKECTIPSSKDLQYIDNFMMLKGWMFRNRHRKVFVYDEAMKNAPSKKAMTALNSEWQRVIPELSKGKIQLFAITQEESMTEKIFSHPTFCIARWEKLEVPSRHPQYRKLVRVSSKGLRQKYEFRNIPPTSLCFNPFRSAEWTMEPSNIDNKNLAIEFRIAQAFAEGKRTPELSKMFPEYDHREKIMRQVRKALQAYIRMSHVTGSKQVESTPSQA